MKRARFTFERISDFYLEDCQRIQLVFLTHGYDATLDQCQRAWHSYSEDHYCAGWLSLPKEDGAIIEALTPYIVEEHEPPDGTHG